jgi:hypothetical protein
VRPGPGLHHLCPDSAPQQIHEAFHQRRGEQRPDPHHRVVAHAAAGHRHHRRGARRHRVHQRRQRLDGALLEPTGEVRTHQLPAACQQLGRSSRREASSTSGPGAERGRVGRPSAPHQRVGCSRPPSGDSGPAPRGADAAIAERSVGGAAAVSLQPLGALRAGRRGGFDPAPTPRRPAEWTAIHRCTGLHIQLVAERPRPARRRHGAGAAWPTSASRAAAAPESVRLARQRGQLRRQGASSAARVPPPAPPPSAAPRAGSPSSSASPGPPSSVMEARAGPPRPRGRAGCTGRGRRAHVRRELSRCADGLWLGASLYTTTQGRRAPPPVAQRPPARRSGRCKRDDKDHPRPPSPGAPAPQVPAHHAVEVGVSTRTSPGGGWRSR